MTGKILCEEVTDLTNIVENDCIKIIDYDRIETGVQLRCRKPGDFFTFGKDQKRKDAGKLVPDQLVIDLLKERIAKRDCKSGFILDGFPRTIPQAEALDEIAKIDCALALEVPNEVIEKRMTGRRVCLRCGATYHVEANPPRVADVCDICGDKLVIRSDDQADVVRHRLETYHEQTEPLKGYYDAQGKLKSIDGTKGIHETEKFAVEALGL